MLVRETKLVECWIIRDLKVIVQDYFDIFTPNYHAVKLEYFSTFVWIHRDSRFGYRDNCLLRKDKSYPFYYNYRNHGTNLFQDSRIFNYQYDHSVGTLPAHYYSLRLAVTGFSI